MAKQVLGLAPISFVSEDKTTVGVQYQIPLASLKYDETKGLVDPADWPPVKSKKLAAADGKLLPLLLADLLKRGILWTQ
jgi:hypothetical protein